jgi:hypothetical protein
MNLPTELQDLLDRPIERESVELKSWVELSDKASPARAAVARHLAAISNFGGGYLVFGFNDDGTQCQPLHDVRKSYSHDVVAGIIDRYLQPKFQCEVHFEVRGAVEHAIVRVPPHGTVPVISKADGPQSSGGQPQGIRAGLVYVRSPKPESVAISRPEQWRELIQRCVLARRDELVRMFSEIVSSSTTSGADQPRERERKKLEEFHQATQQAWVDTLVRVAPKTKVSAAKNFIQLSYAIRRPNGEQIPPDKLLGAIEKAHLAVRDTVHYGWSMFYPFTRPEIRAQFMTDPRLDGGETEFVQCSVIEKEEPSHLDLWRLSVDGRASIVRNYQEDRYAEIPPGLEEQQRWFDGWLHARDVTEIVRHAHALSDEFDEVTDICFRVEWQGLKGRVAGAINPERYWSPHVSQGDSRVVSSCFPQGEVIGNVAAVVSSLYAPVHRLFDPTFDPSPEWVRHQLPRYKVAGLGRQ